MGSCKVAAIYFKIKLIFCHNYCFTDCDNIDNHNKNNMYQYLIGQFDSN